MTRVRGWPPEYQSQVCIAILVCRAVAPGLGIRWGWQAAPPVPRDLPISTRRPGMTLLGARAVYLFLWPRRP
jgi:hypothetical protein